MKLSQRVTIAWAVKRVTYLDIAKRYKDGYAISQEFCGWTTDMSNYPEEPNLVTLNVPNLTKKSVQANDLNQELS